MGYEIYSKIAIIPNNDRDKLIQWIKENKLDFIFNESNKWYGIEEDIANKLSVHFPKIFFIVLFYGEQPEDDKYFIIHNGTYTKNIQIVPSDELERMYNGEGYNEDEDRDWHERMDKLRLDLLDQKIKELGLEEISDYFEELE
jgi:hypothetical protein